MVLLRQWCRRPVDDGSPGQGRLRAHIDAWRKIARPLFSDFDEEAGLRIDWQIRMSPSGPTPYVDTLGRYLLAIGREKTTDIGLPRAHSSFCTTNADKSWLYILVVRRMSLLELVFKERGGGVVFLARDVQRFTLCQT